MIRYATLPTSLLWLTLVPTHPAVSETPTPSAEPPALAAASGDDMQAGEALVGGQSIQSPNGRYSLIYQGDGNLVLYGPGGPLWASNTGGRPVGAAIMQGDGNLVVRGPKSADVFWDSATDDKPGSRLVIQDDGNVVIYRPDGAAVWATSTAQALNQ